MKRLLCIFVLICVFAVPVFSQVAISGWGRIVWLPVLMGQEVDDDGNQLIRTVVQAPWADDAGFDFLLRGVVPGGQIGANVDLLIYRGNDDLGVVAQAANMNAWWAPNRSFKLHLGNTRVHTLRGRVGSSSGTYSYARGRSTGHSAMNTAILNDPAVMIEGGDGIFSRFNMQRHGALMEVTAIPNMYIGAAVQPEFWFGRGYTAKEVYKGIHFAAGYDIRDVGMVRAAFIGGGFGNDQRYANAAWNYDFSYDKRLEAALALTNISGILMDMGLKYSLEENPGNLDRPGFMLDNPLYLAFALNYTKIANTFIGFAIDGHFLGKAERSAPQVAFTVFPHYELNILGGLRVGGDFTFGMQFGDIESINDRKTLGFGIYGQKTYSGGNSFRAGVYASAPMNDDEKWGLTVPIWITYSF